MECLPKSGDAAIDSFLKAFRRDDAPAVRKILAESPTLTARINDPIGPFNSPPMTNVRSREMLDVLLEAGADLNAKSRWWAGGFGLLHSAGPELATYAIERGAIVDIHAAARLGMLERVKEFIESDPGLVHARGGDGQLPLHFARTVEVAEYLLQHGADINARDVDHESTAAQWMTDERHEVARYLVARDCETDLLLASALGDIELARRLLDADPECVRIAVNDKYFPKRNPHSGGTIYQWTLGFHATPHTVARKFGHEDVLRLLFERSPATVKLVNACWLGDEATVREILAAEPKMREMFSAEEQKQVAHAARNNAADAVRLLLEAGFPVDATGQHEGTALHWAAFHGSLEMVKTILAFGPSLELLDADYRVTPLGWAIYGSENAWSPGGNHAGTVETLLQAGAQPPAKISGTAAVQEVLRQHRSEKSA